MRLCPPHKKMQMLVFRWLKQNDKITKASPAYMVRSYLRKAKCETGDILKYITYLYEMSMKPSTVYTEYILIKIRTQKNYHTS